MHYFCFILIAATLGFSVVSAELNCYFCDPNDPATQKCEKMKSTFETTCDTAENACIKFNIVQSKNDKFKEGVYRMCTAEDKYEKPCKNLQDQFAPDITISKCSTCKSNLCNKGEHLVCSFYISMFIIIFAYIFV